MLKHNWLISVMWQVNSQWLWILLCSLVETDYPRSSYGMVVLHQINIFFLVLAWSPGVCYGFTSYFIVELKFWTQSIVFSCLELFYVTVIISNTDNCIITTFFWSICFSLWVLPWFLYHFFLSQLFLIFYWNSFGIFVGAF